MSVRIIQIELFMNEYQHSRIKKERVIAEHGNLLLL